MICSNCLLDPGLRIAAENIGILDTIICSSCGSAEGKKINKAKAKELMEEFFEIGSVDLRVGNQQPKYCLNEGLGKIIYPLPINSELTADVAELSALSECTLDLNYSRNTILGRRGYFADTFSELTNQPETPELWDKIDSLLRETVDKFEIDEKPTGTKLFRIKRDLKEDISVTNSNLFDPPNGQTNSKEKKYRDRFGGDGIPVFYAALDVDTCLFEVHPGFQEELTVGVFESTKPLKLLNLDFVKGITTSGDENHRLSSFVIQEMYGRDYTVCQYLSYMAVKMKFDGLEYPSFYSKVRDIRHLNVGLFGRPIQNGTLKAVGFSRIAIQKVEYDFALGPNFYQQLETKLVNEVSSSPINGKQQESQSHIFRSEDVDIHTLANAIKFRRIAGQFAGEIDELT